MRRVVVALEAAGATRWALAFDPDRVVRYALAQRPAGEGGNATVSEEPLACEGWSNAQTVTRGCSPLFWTPVMAPHPRVTVPWPVLRHAGGLHSGRRFLVWMDVKETENERDSVVLRLRADFHAGKGGEEGTELWRAGRGALPASAALFGKASTPQSLALFAELRLE